MRSLLRSLKVIGNVIFTRIVMPTINRPSKKTREEEHRSIKMLCNFLSNSIKVQKRFLITFRRLVGTIGKGQSTRSSTKREHVREEGVYFTQRSEKQMNITIYDVNYK